MKDDEESKLFSAEFGDIKPIPQDKVTQAAKPESPLNRQLRQEAATHFKVDKNYLVTGAIEPVLPNDILKYKISGLQEGVFRKFRLGHYPIEAKLDLHRRTVDESRKDLYAFLQQCIKMQLRTILITHGKGEKSTPPSILKSHVNHWLRQVPQVHAFHSAVPRHGGTGSVYVLLAKSIEKRLENREKYS
ncbi:MAG: DNA endonuclease SmrA [Pseudomonadota bacterium]